LICENKDKRVKGKAQKQKSEKVGMRRAVSISIHQNLFGKTQRHKVKEATKRKGDRVAKDMSPFREAGI
jgi:hypothetical protein